MDSVPDDYQDIEPEHFEQSVQGLIDTVEGVEGFSKSYTQAQKFLWSCMDSSDAIDYKQRREGMEGILSAVGDGLKAAWEYIEKLFKSIWGFFFGGGSDDSGDTTTAKVKANDKELDEFSEGGTSAESTKKVVSKVKSRAKAIQNDPKSSSSNKSKAKEVEEKIDKLGDSPSSSSVKPLVKEVVDASQVKKEQFSSTMRVIWDRVTGFKDALGKDRKDEIKDADLRQKYLLTFNSSRTEFTWIVSKNWLMDAINSPSLATGKTTQKHITEITSKLGKSKETIKNWKGTLDKELKDIKTQVAGNKNDETLKQKLNDMKVLGSLLLTLRKQYDGYYKELLAASNAVNSFVGA